MGDSDLDAIRRARLQELQSQNAGGAGLQGGKEDEQRSREAEARQSILSQILEPEAADRLGRIRLVKASRAEDVENRLIALARSGQLRSRVSEVQLKELLNAVAEQQSTAEPDRLTVHRRKGGWDDDDLDDLLEEE